MLSIVIPTYQEVENLKLLVPVIRECLSQNNIPFEIIIVDDNSQDGSEELINSLNFTDVRLVVRKSERGLSSAVYNGLSVAKGEILCFMDADFSHPPEALSGMYRMINSGIDLVVGSRFVEGGGTQRWPFVRKLTSWVARIMARPLTPVKDVTTGFFMFKSNVVPEGKLNLNGFKIGLEILVKGNYTTVREFPIVFKDRQLGYSKLTGKVMREYLAQLFELYTYRLFRR